MEVSFWDDSLHFPVSFILFYFLDLLWKNIGIRRELIPLSKRANLLLLKEKLIFHHGNQHIIWHTCHMAHEIRILSEINFYRSIMSFHVRVARTRIRWHLRWLWVKPSLWYLVAFSLQFARDDTSISFLKCLMKVNHMLWAQDKYIPSSPRNGTFPFPMSVRIKDKPSIQSSFCFSECVVVTASY